jgi:hypothetical protein
VAWADLLGDAVHTVARRATVAIAAHSDKPADLSRHPVRDNPYPRRPVPSAGGGVVADVPPDAVCDVPADAGAGAGAGAGAAPAGADPAWAGAAAACAGDGVAAAAGAAAAAATLGPPGVKVAALTTPSPFVVSVIGFFWFSAASHPSSPKASLARQARKVKRFVPVSAFGERSAAYTACALNTRWISCGSLNTLRQ